MARRACDRCPAAEDLEPLGPYDLCPPCLFDAKRVLESFVASGRTLHQRVHLSGKAPAGARWAQCAALIEQHGYVTCRIFRLSLGVTGVQARDYLHTNKKLGKLVSILVEKEARFYLPGDIPDTTSGDTELAG